MNLSSPLKHRSVIKRIARGFFRVSVKFLCALIACVLIYTACIKWIPYIAVGNQITSSDDTISIYLWSNGVHTDFVLPTYHQMQDWSALFLPKYVKDGQAREWIAIGWGDKGFYLNTPTWADLKVSTALQAAFGFGSTALHITYHDQAKLDQCTNCAKLELTKSQYQALIDYIKSDIQWQKDQAIVISSDAVYGTSDAFFEAKGSYFLFYTCNTWINNGLKHISAPAALWTITDKGIFQHYAPSASTH